MDRDDGVVILAVTLARTDLRGDRPRGQVHRRRRQHVLHFRHFLRTDRLERLGLLHLLANHREAFQRIGDVRHQPDPYELHPVPWHAFVVLAVHVQRHE